MHEKIQKVLAGLGIGSRREIERWIKVGRVKINEGLAQIGDRIDQESKIYIDDQLVERKLFQSSDKVRVLIYHKPVGEICSRRDPGGRPTPFQHLPILKHGRWIMVGRLDINTSGLLLFTNSGELANALMHPSSQIDRIYAVRVFGEVKQNDLKRLKRGIVIEGHKMRFQDIQHVGGEGLNQWYHVILREGRNREVRRLWESQGFKVNRLIRIQFADIVLPEELKPGEFLELSEEKVEQLFHRKQN